VTLDEVLEAFAAHQLDRVAVVGAVARNAWAPPRATAELIAHRSRDVEDIRAIIQTQERAGRQIDRAHIERWAAYWDISARWRRLESDVLG
jgi:hypothetical protein